METIKEIIIDNIKFEICRDDLEYLIDIDMWDSEEEKQVIIDKVNKGELNVYAVVEYRRDSVNGEWVEKEGIGSLLHENWQDCLSYYLDQYEAKNETNY